MTALASTYRRPRGLMIALLILGVVDLVACVTCAASATKGLELSPVSQARLFNQMLELAFGLLMLQSLLRLVMLTLRALWARRLVHNIHLFHAFPVSPLWAWAGFMVPGVSLWLPGRTMLALGNADGHRPRALGGLCLVWAIARWLTCISGALFIFIVLVVIGAYQEITQKQEANSSRMILALTLGMALAGIVANLVGPVVVAWIARRQPNPGQLRSAEVF